MQPPGDLSGGFPFLNMSTYQDHIPPKSARILVAMSGGVDSAVTASLLVKAGYDCVGVTMRLVPEHEGKSPFEPCCGIEAANDACRVCHKLGIPHEVMYAVDRFDRDIITNFVDEYLAGRTPNPCVRCNRMIKFGALYQQMDQMGLDYVAMGHYARLQYRDDRVSLRRSLYRPKDQSYVLAPLTQNQLRRAWFPLGHMTKEAVREHARELDLKTANKPESMEICFVPENNYRDVVRRRATNADRPGPILNTRGEVLGEHTGIINYTLGQRRGLGIAAERPLYVLRLDSARNAVIVGYEEESLSNGCTTGTICWGGMAPANRPFRCRVQLRSHHDAVPATVTPQRGATIVTFDTPQKSVTPGQWAVFYDEEDFLLGSAMIRAFEAAGTAATSA